MRVAICFSGQVERLYNYHHLFKEHLKAYNHDCDLFFSFWGNDSDEEHLRNFLSIMLPPNASIAAIEFTPLYEWDSPYNQSHMWGGGHYTSLFFQAAGIKNVDQLRQRYEREHDFEYDMVIRTRPDIYIKGKLDLITFNSLLDDRNTILSPANRRYPHLWNCPIHNRNPNYLGQGMMCDQWLAAKSNDMSNITKYVDFINQYTADGSRFHQETLLWWHTQKVLNLNCKLMDFRVILRDVDDD